MQKVESSYPRMIILILQFYGVPKFGTLYLSVSRNTALKKSLSRMRQVSTSGRNL